MVERNEAILAWTRCELLNDDCALIEEHGSQIWDIINSSVDAGAFRINNSPEGLELIYGADGTTDWPEWYGNLVKWGEILGIHGNWMINGLELFYVMNKQLEGMGYTLSDFEKFTGFGHSRGGPLVLIMSEQIFDCTGKRPHVDTFGCPPFANEDKVKELEEKDPYDHIAWVTKYDFVDNLSAPKFLKIFKKWYKDHKYYVYYTEIIKLPDADGFDHLHYLEPIIEYFNKIEKLYNIGNGIYVKPIESLFGEFIGFENSNALYHEDEHGNIVLEDSW